MIMPRLGFTRSDGEMIYAALIAAAESKRLDAGRGPADKAAVVAAVERNGDVITKAVNRTDKETLQGFVRSNVAEGSLVMTEESRSYSSLSGRAIRPRNGNAFQRGVCGRPSPYQ